MGPFDGSRHIFKKFWINIFYFFIQNFCLLLSKSFRQIFIFIYFTQILHKISWKHFFKVAINFQQFFNKIYLTFFRLASFFVRFNFAQIFFGLFVRYAKTFTKIFHHYLHYFRKFFNSYSKIYAKFSTFLRNISCFKFCPSSFPQVYALISEKWGEENNAKKEETRRQEMIICLRKRP